MKAAVIFTFALLLLAAIIDVSFTWNCARDPNYCNDHQCCMESYSCNSRYDCFGRQHLCDNRQVEGASCEVEPATSSFGNHVYTNKCPCHKGLVCEKDGPNRGTCVKK